ncbi:unnamed protein product [Lampetra fluviatilis]
MIATEIEQRDGLWHHRSMSVALDDEKMPKQVQMPLNKASEKDLDSVVLREMAAGKVKQSRGLNMEEVMLLQRELEMEESEEEMNDGTPRWASVFYDAALPLAMYAVLLAAFVLETLWNVISGSKS